MKILRLVVGGESWPVRPEVKDETGEWEIFEENFIPDESGIEGAVRCYLDIHELDGDPPSLWKVVDDDRVLFEIDGRCMTALERAACPPEIREAGRELFGEMIKDRVDETLDRLEKLVDDAAATAEADVSAKADAAQEKADQNLQILEIQVDEKLRDIEDEIDRKKDPNV